MSFELSNTDVVIYLLDALAGAILFIMSLSLFLGNNLLRSTSLLLILPSVAICTQLSVDVFLTYPNLFELSDQMYGTIAHAFMLVFLFMYAKLLCRFEVKYTLNKFVVVSFFCFSTTVIYVVPALVSQFLNNEINI